MKNEEEPPEQTGAYLLYVTVCEGGSDKVIRGIARFYFRASGLSPSNSGSTKSPSLRTSTSSI